MQTTEAKYRTERSPDDPYKTDYVDDMGNLLAEVFPSGGEPGKWCWDVWDRDGRRCGGTAKTKAAARAIVREALAEGWHLRRAGRTAP